MERYFFLFVPMWDLLFVPRAVKIQKENGGSPCIFSEIIRPKDGGKVLTEHFFK